MEKMQILKADLLDILFEGRNKTMAPTTCVNPIQKEWNGR